MSIPLRCLKVVFLKSLWKDDSSDIYFCLSSFCVPCEQSWLTTISSFLNISNFLCFSQSSVQANSAWVWRFFWSVASRSSDWILDLQCSLTSLFSFDETSRQSQVKVLANQSMLPLVLFSICEKHSIMHSIIWIFQTLFSKQAFHSINLSNIHFFIANQGSTWLAKTFLHCHENFAHAQQKNNQTQAELVFSSETDWQKNNIEEGGEWGNAGSACKVAFVVLSLWKEISYCVMTT